MAPTARETDGDAPSRTPGSDLARLRAEVRAFVAQQRAAGAFAPGCDAWQRGFSRAFSRELGARGWVAMTVPRRYGGAGRSAHERFVVAEELLAGAAPVAAHWIAERQIAPAILRHGTEAQKQRYLPPIARGELVFGLGMSEPGSGSDLASVRTRAVPAEGGGWRVSGQKIWTTHAHHADHLLVLCRTRASERAHDGLSQLLVDCSADGVDIRPIETIDGEAHFCEVFLDDVLVGEDALLGVEGAGWTQVTSELAYERGGPERYLSSLPLLEAFVADAQLTARRDAAATEAVGELVAELTALRGLATRISQAIEEGRPFAVDAALLKDAGTTYEQRLVERLRRAGAAQYGGTVRRLLADVTLYAPAFTLRGGTTEILRGIVSRELVSR